MSTTDPKYPAVEVRLSEEDGNGFMIASRVRSAITKHLRRGTPEERAEAEAEGVAFFNEALSGSYDHLVQTCMKWVTVS